MVLGGVISNLLSLGAKLLPAFQDSPLQTSSSSSSFPPSNENQKIKTELEALMRMLQRIKATLYDAEQREIREKSVELWLMELKGVAYDAEDVLDEYQYEVLRAQVEARDASADSCKTKLIEVPEGMFDQIQQIRRKFDEIEKDRAALRLSDEDGPRHLNNELQKAPTSHLVDESAIFGREEEKEKLIDMLFCESHDGKVVSVVAIVGPGGLGKTTLAQLAYNDQRVKQGFDKFGWICVSDNFIVERLTRESVESFGSSSCGFTNLSVLQEKVCELIRGKRVLLVLDDVWNENNILWDSFCTPFKSASSMKIVVTTRNEHVATIMETVPIFKLGYMSHEQCWQLFKHHAFGGVNQSEGTILVQIGKQILKKCGMLPLAVKSIASLLRHESNEESWREILESELWETDAGNEIFSSLHLSYAHLPTYLKPCLTFCSMFPKGFKYNLQKLVQFWILHGYIESKGNKSAMKIGLEYGRQLGQRSFFENIYGSTNWEAFKLHDMIHDLARLKTKNGCYSIEAGLSSKLPEFSNELYHLSITGFKKTIELIPFEKFTTLRTLIIMGLGVENFISNTDLPLPKKLRVLEIDKSIDHKLGFISQNHESEFASSVGNLKHLRYLLLGDLPFERLPECICSLYNLKNLKLQNCAFNELPKGIGNLVSLETLMISCCDFLEWMPESFCQLKALRNLKLHSCKQLQKFPPSIGNLISLENLEIRECDFLEWLPESLCQLKNLRNLKLVNLEKLKKLPPSLGNLVNLEELYLICCDFLEWLPESLCQLKTLRELILECNKLKELPNDLGSLTNLQSLHILCNEVNSLPLSLGKVVGIQKLSVGLECEKIGWLKDFVDLGGTLSLGGLDNVCNLTDVQCANLVSMHNLEFLQLYWDCVNNFMDDNEVQLYIERSQGTYLENQNDFVVMATLQPHPNLKKLNISCYGGTKFPEWIGNPRSCASLERLALEGCKNLRFLPFGSLSKLKYVSIHGCDSLKLIKAEWLPPEIEELNISHCKELIFILGIQNLKSLIKLHIDSCENLLLLLMDTEYFIKLTKCPNESSYQNSQLGLRNITSLRNLHISYCPKLRLLEDELLCVGSCEVEVGECPLLKEWCLQHGINYINYEDYCKQVKETLNEIAEVANTEILDEIFFCFYMDD